MRSAAYILGTLDVLEQAGEVSPAYAAGARNILEKQAFVRLLAPAARLARFGAAGAARVMRRYPRVTAAGLGLVGLDQYRRATGQSDRFNDTLRELNAARGGTDSNIRLTRDDTLKALDASRPWWDNLGGRSVEWLRSKVRPLKSFAPGNTKTWDDYVLDHENWVRADEQDYMRRANLEGRAGGPLGQWALADLHARHSDIFNDYATAAQHWMPRSQREDLGLPEKPINMYQTPYTQSAITGGLYRLKHDYGKKPEMTGYGGSGVSAYGDTAPLLRSDIGRLPPRRI